MNFTPKATFKWLFAACFFFTSCINAKKIDRQVAIQYNHQLPAKAKAESNHIVITSDYPSDDLISQTKAKTSKVLPLLFYWSMDYKNTCTLNPQIPISNFSKTVYSYADQRLKEKLNGGTLEMHIDTIPNKFAVDDKGHLIFFGFAYGWDNISVIPEPQNMVISYKLTKDKQEMKKGTIVVPSMDTKQNLGFFPKLNKALEEYVALYNQHITTMSKTAVDQIAAAL